MSEQRLVDITGRVRSPAATPGHWAGCAPPNKGLPYPADPPSVEEIILVMREAGPGPSGSGSVGVILDPLARGLADREALTLSESDLDAKTGAVLVRAGKGGKRSDGRDGPLGVGALCRCAGYSDFGGDSFGGGGSGGLRSE